MSFLSFFFFLLPCAHLFCKWGCQNIRCMCLGAYDSIYIIVQICMHVLLNIPYCFVFHTIVGQCFHPSLPLCRSALSFLDDSQYSSPPWKKVLLLTAYPLPAPNFWRRVRELSQVCNLQGQRAHILTNYRFSLFHTLWQGNLNLLDAVTSMVSKLLIILCTYTNIVIDNH